MTVAANLFLLCILLVFINKPPITTNNITRISTVMTNSTSMTKAAVGGATKCIRDARRSKYVHPQMTQMIQLRDLEQPIPGSTLTTTLASVTHIFKAVVYSLRYILPVEIAIGLLASASNCRIVVLIITPTQGPWPAEQ